MKAKEWLKANGHIDAITRGRISGVNHGLLADAHANGQKFSDWEPKETTNASGEKVVKNATPKGTDSQGIGEAFIRYPSATSGDPDESWVAIEIESGIKRSMREACGGCGLSLVGHRCNDPRIVPTAKSIIDQEGHVRVRIERK